MENEKEKAEEKDEQKKPNKNVDVVEPRIQPDWEDFIKDAYYRNKTSTQIIKKSDYESHIRDPKHDE